MNYPDAVTCEVVIVRLQLYLVSAVPRGEALAMAEHFEACLECAHHLVLVRRHG